MGTQQQGSWCRDKSSVWAYMAQWGTHPENPVRNITISQGAGGMFLRSALAAAILRVHIIVMQLKS
jgi:hypothetical protein